MKLDGYATTDKLWNCTGNGSGIYKGDTGENSLNQIHRHKWIGHMGYC